MRSEAPKVLRCAIYTRKSSEEGLEQAFNSLDAQRDACTAFVESQHHEGWRLIKTLYDDGGYSGGTMERPALKKLLKDIDDRAIDVVVVYKVDRLTRSLADFAKIVEIFDAHRVSFVSVTQQFNTTSSMGRLTLNVLLSFAQFEREVTGERIRDKIAASKRKGMWMGGCVPLGYDVDGRRLIVNRKEATIVRSIYRRYLALGCVAKLQLELKTKQIKSKTRISKSTGRTSGGQTYSRGALYAILQNQLYRGAVAHRGVIYPRQHEAIIAKPLWEAVQKQLQTNGQARRNGIKTDDPSLLSGLIYDDRGNRLTPCHTLKRGKRYRYYVSQAVIHGRSDQLGYTKRVPAHDIESLVAGRVLQLLKTPQTLLDTLSLPLGDATMKDVLLSAAKDRVARWTETAPTDLRLFLLGVISKVIIQKNAVTIVVSKAGLRDALLNPDAPTPSVKPKHGPQDQLRFTVKTSLKRGGREVRLIVPAEGGQEAPQVNPSLMKAIVRGHYWYEQLLTGKAESVTAIAKASAQNDRYVTRIIQCAFLAPDIIEAILNGRQPIDLTLDKMRVLPIDWKEQRRVLGFVP